MEIILTAVEKGGDHPIKHDLNFQHERYEANHVIVRVVPALSDPDGRADCG